MAKWTNVYIVKLSPDDIIHKSAALYRGLYQVPAERRFSQHSDDREWTNVQQGEPLQNVTLQDKLMLVTHSTKTLVAGRDAASLAAWLADICGLRAAGLITFKGCSVGRGPYLESFVTACSNNHIQVGWVKGYRGDASTWAGLDGTEKPREMVQNKHSKGYKEGASRYRIVEGTHPMTVQDSRYFVDGDDQ